MDNFNWREFSVDFIFTDVASRVQSVECREQWMVELVYKDEDEDEDEDKELELRSDECGVAHESAPR